MNDDRISRYLQDQAQGITLAPVDSSAAVRRGNRRRARRRAGLLGSVAVVGVLATSIAVRDGGHDEVVSQLGSSAAASTFDWSTVTPRSGLGYGDNTAQLADGSVYSISTAPGPYREDAPNRSTLYRSSDGAEWSAASLPDGVRSSDLAGVGDTLYSLGTVPAGGLVLSSSSDGAASWTSSSLPGDVTALQARHPGLITVGPARLAAKDGTHLVASIVATTQLDLAKLGHPEYNDGYVVDWDANGANVRENPKAQCDPEAPANADATAVAKGMRTLADGTVQSCRAENLESGAVVKSFSYDELGVTGELREHIGGVPYVYASDDGTTFSRVTLPTPVSDSAGDGYVATPVATDDGYRLVISGSDASGPIATILSSADGTSWTADAVLPGSPNEVGVLGGRAAISLFDKDGSSGLRVEQGAGSWTPIDVGAAVPAADGTDAYVESVSFGPLGFAAVVGTSSGDGPYHQYVVHSTDGSTLQVLDVDDHVDTKGMVSGLVVTADAIVVRVTAPSDGDDSTPPEQEVLVGTPPS